MKTKMNIADSTQDWINPSLMILESLKIISTPEKSTLRKYEDDFYNHLFCMFQQEELMCLHSFQSSRVRWWLEMRGDKVQQLGRVKLQAGRDTWPRHHRWCRQGWPWCCWRRWWETWCWGAEMAGADDLSAHWHTWTINYSFYQLLQSFTMIQTLSTDKMWRLHWESDQPEECRSWQRSCWDSWECRWHRRSGRVSSSHTCQIEVQWILQRSMKTSILP